MPRASAKKKPNVRAEMIRLALRATAAVSPRTAARGLEKLFLRTRRHPTPDRERSWLETAEPTQFESRGESLAAWVWGDGPRTALLAHGWEGRGAQLGSFAAPLTDAGFRVVTFDAPGHGASPNDRSSLVEMAEAVRDASAHFGPFDGIVAHSAGAAATAIALDHGLETGRAVFIAPPTDLGAFLATVTAYLGLSRDVERHTRERLEERFGVRWESLALERIAPTMRTPLLVLHDREDREVAFDNGEALASLWPEARLVATEGLGHRRVLRDPEVVRQAAAFLGSG